MARTILAFNGDFESRLALHWLVHQRNYDVITLSVNLGQEVYLEPLGELALELGASAAQVLDRRESFLRDFAFPLLQAGAVYQTSCFLGSALASYVIANELVRLAHAEGCTSVAHSAASKGNDQVRMETAIAAQDPRMEVLAPVREWNFKDMAAKLEYAKTRGVPIETPKIVPPRADRNLWGVSLYFHDLTDTWEAPPDNMFVLTKSIDETPDEPVNIEIGFKAGVPVSIDGKEINSIELVRELNRLGGKHGIGRTDVVEDRLFGIKSREFYEVPAVSILDVAHRDLESLVLSRELLQLKEVVSRRYAELVYTGLWFNDTRRCLHAFFQQTQRNVTGEVRLRLFKGSAAILGRKSPFSLYDPRLANQSNMDLFDNRWAQGFTSLWTLPARMAARFLPEEEQPGGWEAP